EEEREIEEEILAGPEPERSGLHPRFTQNELGGRLHCTAKTIRTATRELCDEGLLAIGRLDGETADNAVVYIVSVGRVREAIAALSASSKARKTPRIRLVKADGNKDRTGAVEVPNRLSTSTAGSGTNDRGSAVKVDRSGGKSGQPLVREDYEDSLVTTEVDSDLSPPPVSNVAVKEGVLRRAGLPKALRGIDIDAIEALDDSYATAAVLAQRWGVGEIPGLVLLGGPGRGKSTLAAGAAWAALARSEALAWLLASQLPRILSTDFGDPALRELTETLNRNCGLILDDLEQMEGKRAARTVAAAIGSRVQAGRPVLVTSSLDLDQLEEEFGERLVSRLVGYCEVAALRGPNLHKLIARRRAA
ncbi:MAG: ATP-binding protein, partial [Solirubrobacterales bacterium]